VKLTVIDSELDHFTSATALTWFIFIFISNSLSAIVGVFYSMYGNGIYFY